MAELAELIGDAVYRWFGKGKAKGIDDLGAVMKGAQQADKDVRIASWK